jgi:hypothetical protein
MSTGRVTWEQRAPGAYECSSKGDARFSAFTALMPDGRTIEQWYQCQVKGYGGSNWRDGKGKPSLIQWPNDEQYNMYLMLWKLWALTNTQLISELDSLAASHGDVLTDCHATTPINQARALAQIINEWFRPMVKS